MSRDGKEHFVRVGAVAGRKVAHVEVPKPEETPNGVPAPVAVNAGPIDRTPDGRFASPQAARIAGRAGGLAKAERDAKRWGRRLGLGRLLQGFTPEEHFAEALKERIAWRHAQAEHVCTVSGGGVLSPGVYAIIDVASWERMFSTLAFEAASSRQFAWDIDEKRTPRTLPRTELMMVGAKLGDSARQNVLAAHSLAAIEARARAERDPTNDAPPGFTVITEGDDG